jgi:hypothetical protein
MPPARTPGLRSSSGRESGPAAGSVGDPRRLQKWLVGACLIAAGLLIPEVVGVVLACRLGRPHGREPAGREEPAEVGGASVAAGVGAGFGPVSSDGWVWRTTGAWARAVIAGGRRRRPSWRGKRA